MENKNMCKPDSKTRPYALLLTPQKWYQINNHLYRKADLQREREEELASQMYLKETSEAMTKNWENSVENIRKRKEALRIERTQDEKAARMERFLQLREDQEDIKKEYIAKAKERIYRDTGPLKELTRALIASEIVYERDQQLKINETYKQFNKELRAKEKYRIDKIVADVLKEDNERAVQLMEKKKKFAVELKKSITDRMESKARTRFNNLENEIFEKEQAMKEMQLIKEIEIQQKKEIQNNAKMISKQAIKDKRDKLLAEKEAERRIELEVQIYNNAKNQSDYEKQQAIKKRRQQEADSRQLIAEKVAGITQISYDQEEARLRTAIAENKAEEERKRLASAEKRKERTKDRIEDHKKFVLKQAQQKQKEMQLKKWEMLNRFKSNQVMQQYNVDKKAVDLQKILNYRKEILEQIKNDKEERTKDQRIKQICESINSFKEADEKFFKYANKVMELAKKKGLDTYQINKVIQNYIWINNLKNPQI